MRREYSLTNRIYPDEAAENLELDFDLVMRITEELRKDGTLEEA